MRTWILVLITLTAENGQLKTRVESAIPWLPQEVCEREATRLRTRKLKDELARIVQCVEDSEQRLEIHR